MAKGKPKTSFEKAMAKVWPNTKKELERMMKNTKALLDKGEKYFKDVSEKSLNSTKKLSLSLQKEKLYYDLGKAAATVPTAKLSTSKKISSLKSKIVKIEREIKKIK